MIRKILKITAGVVVIIILVPVVLLAILLGWCSWADKTTGSMVSSGVTRRYVLYVPKSYDPSKPTPLVISIHPAATWGALQMSLSRWNDLADQQGFIVVYPNGSGAFFGGFSSGPHVWPGEESLPRDVKFISDLIDKLRVRYNINPNRIYVNGMSNGGAMAYALSCELPDRIAAVGVVSPALPPIPGEGDCASRPMPTIAFHGTADKMAPYEGGKSPVAPQPFPNIRDWIAHAAKRNQCQGEPSETQATASVRRIAYTGCAENAEVVLYTVTGGGHTWPGGKHLAEWVAGKTSDEISASRLMWTFYVEHPLGAK